MAGKKAARTENNSYCEQISLYDYQMKEVNVRLVLKESTGLYSTTPISTPQDAVNVMGELLRGSDREMVCVINVDNKLRPINYNIVSIGGLNSAQVPVVNCFKAAMLSNASGVVLLHSHPSGDASPSMEDFEVTKRFVQAGKLLDIPALDHVIIGAYQGEQYSFRENNPDMFYAKPDLSVFPEIDTSKGWHASEQRSEYMAGRRAHMPTDHGKKDSMKKSIIGRLSEKKELAVGMDRAAAEHKIDYSL